MIDHYSFGKMVIHGKIYKHDMIIFQDTVWANWWRKEGHQLCIADIQQAIGEFNPSLIVVGTGKLGMMKVLPETESYLQSHQIRLIAQDTSDACETYNNLMNTEKVLGAFHLTC